MKTQPLDLLDSFPAADDISASATLEQESADFQTKIVVLDDDPTGIQTVHDIFVYTDWNANTLREAFSDPHPLFFILTNSRSFSAEKTVAVHREIAENLCAVSRETGKEFLLLSRSDSTLRGHYPLETEVLKHTLENLTGCMFDGEIICPFFPEGGRYTINNIHYVREKNALIPAGDTEFARDKTFSFHSSDLTEYVEEKTKGVYSKDSCICISLDELRAQDYEGITKKLMSADNFRKIIVNAVCYADLKVFSTSWIRAMKKGKNFLSRCAAALPKVIGKVPDRPLLTAAELCPEHSGNGGLIIIGSHVKKTTEQFKTLLDAGFPLEPLEFHVDTCFRENGLEKEADRILKRTESLIAEGRTVLVYTSRTLLAPDGCSEEELLALSVKISGALTSIVSMLSVRPSFILAKGGITSSDVGTLGLHVHKALILGQIRPGIPVWRTGKESRFPDISYIIFPGNVGGPDTLRDIVFELITEEESE
ncbi:MAG TPA: hydroxyacid dehydrogenase [Candidatus Mediterraneibacter cottocaccae]|nr:hydroxyacid dehydrogenase [Candidatus Mediterraneibacter cottocaccae]